MSTTDNTTWGQIREGILADLRSRKVEPRLDEFVLDGVTYAELLAKPADKPHIDPPAPVTKTAAKSDKPTTKDVK